MGGTRTCLIPSFIILLFCIQAHLLKSQNLTCSSKDLIALEGLLEGLDSRVLGWDRGSSDCCSWFGVKCMSSFVLGLNDSSAADLGQRVVQLNLGNTVLKGIVPKSLGGLDQLRILNLSSNSLSGALPPDLFQLRNLEVLDLSGNSFSGSFPAIANLSSILAFNISGNFFTGNQPILVGSGNLTSYIIHDNLFSGTIDSSLCLSSPLLQVFDLSSNSFIGKIPNGFRKCESLTDLLLNSNNLSGNLPDDLYELSSLTRLQLHKNQFSGTLNARVQNLSNLVHLDISNNAFSGVIPEIFIKLTKLEYFSAGSNYFTGLLPASLPFATVLHHLDLRSSLLNGSINLNCSQLVNLRYLDLASNQFLGPIPDNLSLCSNLETLILDGNNLKGLVPNSLKYLHALSYLSLSHNALFNISRTFEILQQCSNLSTLVLAANFDGEEMPIDQIQGFTNLQVFSMPNCNVSGKIPPWLSNATMLKVLDLSRNHLSGTIPAWLGSLFDLTYLDLSSNGLSGVIPQNLSGIKNLEFLDLSNNSLTGRISNSLTTLTFMSWFNVANNHLEGPIPTAGQFLLYDKTQFEGNLGLCGVYFPPCGQPEARTSPTPASEVEKSKSGMRFAGLPFGLGATVGFVLTVTVCFICGFYSEGKGCRRKPNSLRTFSPITANDDGHDDRRYIESGNRVPWEETIWNWPVPASSRTSRPFPVKNDLALEDTPDLSPCSSGR